MRHGLRVLGAGRDSVAKIQKDQAEAATMAKKQAADQEKSAMAQCGALSGDAKSQCKKNAEAAHDKSMADAKANRKGQGRLQGDQVVAATMKKGRLAAPFQLAETTFQRTTAICSRLSPL